MSCLLIDRSDAIPAKSPTKWTESDLRCGQLCAKFRSDFLANPLVNFGVIEKNIPYFKAIEMMT